MVEFVFRKEKEKIFLQKWEEYVSKNLATYRYLPLYLDYMHFYTKNLIADESFVIVADNQSVAICFLPIEDFDNGKIIALANDYTIAPLSINKKIQGLVYKKCEEIAKIYNVKKMMFYIDPLITKFQNKFNVLRKYGFIDTTTSDCLLDLRKTEKQLWSDVRKGHKYDINRILKKNDFEIVRVDYKNANYDIHEVYRGLHRKCAGRSTRSKETFDKQFEMLQNDKASLFGLKYKGNFIGFNYFLHYQKTAVYYSGADDPNYTNIPIYHPLLWSAITYYKSRNFAFLEFSTPCGYSYQFDDYLDEKQLNISHFKRGFGGEMVPLFRGVKYFDKESFLQDWDMFKNKIMATL